MSLLCMRSQSMRSRSTSLFLALFLTLPVFAGFKRVVPDTPRQLRAAVAAAAVETSIAADDIVHPNTPCFAGEIKCGQTRTGRVSVDSCEVDLIFAVGYLFV